MARGLILLTGASGFIGYQILLKALEAGYNIRCAVRSSKSIDQVLAGPTIKSLGPNPEQLSWVTVPDITAPGAYDEATKDVDYIIHCASPVHDKNVGQTNEETFYKPAVQSTVGMLESAASHKPSSVKRIVITSSLVAVFPPDAIAGQPLTSSEPVTAYTRQEPVMRRKTDYGPYIVSKIKALNETDAWVQKHSPEFGVVNIMPAWVFGKDERATSSEALMASSNAILLAPLTGVKSDNAVNSAVVSIEDVALAHVRALEASVSGKESFIVGRPENIASVKEIAKKRFPDAFEDGTFSDEGHWKYIHIPIDSGDADERLGIKLRDFESIVEDVAGQYLELVKQ